MARHRRGAFALVAAYLALLALLQGLPARARFLPRLAAPSRLRTCWNASLALFSLVGFSRLLPAVALHLLTEGLDTTLCAPEVLQSLGAGAAGLWTWLFVLSKAIELIDTLLLVEHGKPLTLLHVFHHSSVLAWSWHEYASASTHTFIFATLNYAAHLFMYTYFALAEWRGAASMRRIARSITAFQITQMCVGIGIACRAWLRCSPHVGVTPLLSGLLFTCYLVLFLQYADEAYALRLRLRIFADSLARPPTSGYDEMCEADLARRPWQRPGLSTRDAFLAACAALPMYVGHVERAEGLELYGLYKQARLGDAPPDDIREGDAPPRQGAGEVSRATIKARAWGAKRGLQGDECMRAYVKLLATVSQRVDVGGTGAANRAAARARRSARSTVTRVPPPPSSGKALYCVQIRGLGRYLPERVVPTSEVEARGGFAPGELCTRRCGVEQRRRASPSEGPSRIAAAAAREALAEAGLHPSDLDAIVNGSFSSEQLIPDASVRIQHELGLDDSGIPCFTVNATCLSFLVAMDVAAALLQRPDGEINTVLVCSAEVVNHGVDPFDAHTAPLFGEGAAAAILSRTDDGAMADGATSSSAIEAFLMRTFSSGRDLTAFRQCGSSLPPYSRDESVDPRTPNPALDYASAHFVMRGEETVRFVAERMPKLLEELRPGLSRGLGDIDWVVPHQASGLALDSLSIYGWSQERVLRTLPHLGNCLAASIPMTLYEGVRSGKIRRGHRVLLCGTGAGLSFAGCVLTY